MKEQKREQKEATQLQQRLPLLHQLSCKILTSDISKSNFEYCLWKEILCQQRIRHFKILQSIYFAYDVGIISSYSTLSPLSLQACSLASSGEPTGQPLKDIHMNQHQRSPARWRHHRALSVTRRLLFEPKRKHMRYSDHWTCSNSASTVCDLNTSNLPLSRYYISHHTVRLGKRFKQTGRLWVSMRSRGKVAPVCQEK